MAINDSTNLFFICIKCKQSRHALHAQMHELPFSSSSPLSHHNNPAKFKADISVLYVLFILMLHYLY